MEEVREDGVYTEMRQKAGFVGLHLADAFIQSDLQLHSGYRFFFISMCVPWESNPQSFALLTQCSTTEPHRNTGNVTMVMNDYHIHDMTLQATSKSNTTVLLAKL